MSFFEFLPLIVILALQFIYQFQKAAKKRAANRKKKNLATKKPLEENTNLPPILEENPDSINERTSNKYTTPIYQEFFQDTFNIPSPFKVEEAREEENNFDNALPPEESVNYDEEIATYTEDFSNDKTTATSLPYSTTKKPNLFKKSIVNLLKNNSKKAIILNEILGKPKF